MSDTKTEILAGLRSALADHPAAPEVPREYRRSSEISAADTLDMLEDRLIDYKANVYRETTGSIAGRIAELLGESTRVVLPPELDGQWLPEGEQYQWIVDTRGSEEGETLTAEELNNADAVVTSSTVSCAETGTIFLSGQKDEGRRAITLVPDHHICVVRTDTVVELIPESLERLDPVAPITMISGPSATSDIELVRVEGVHGPRTLDVIFLQS
ncbi:LutC/YkgG family protein [Corynebacterium lubricantis]|uniref:LutC/YkgG family protein n=1 Tax=Corynebacterium lubricantis TaxID=541095 RepID=UPI00035F450F|nr:LUD domain-containing protein [Corynebacterium lubricantis]